MEYRQYQVELKNTYGWDIASYYWKCWSVDERSAVKQAVRFHSQHYSIPAHQFKAIVVKPVVYRRGILTK
jgi:hypothetical protein